MLLLSPVRDAIAVGVAVLAHAEGLPSALLIAANIAAQTSGAIR
jgi:hypothetical protein